MAALGALIGMVICMAIAFKTLPSPFALIAAFAAGVCFGLLILAMNEMEA